MSQLSIWTKAFLGLVVFSLLGSLLSARTGLDPGMIKPVASLLTLMAGFLALAQLVKWWQTAMVLMLGACAEICGLYTGLPFGRYEYTDNWWPVLALPQQHSFPLLLPIAWFLVAGGSALALKPLGKPMLLLAPLLATLIDFLMEPVMVESLQYWRWLDAGPLPGGAPWANTLGWLATSALAAWALSFGTEKRAAADAKWVLIGFVGLIIGIWVITGWAT